MMPAHHQAPCPFCVAPHPGYDKCPSCDGTQVYTWMDACDAVQWVKANHPCPGCRSSKWMKRYRTGVTRLVCLSCYANVHRHNCGCDRWEGLEVSLAVKTLEDMKESA